MLHLILFQPDSIDEYVSRIGRVGNLGKATSFFDPYVTPFSSIVVFP
jgi:superfamily II DNA/RNA helicase